MREPSARSLTGLLTMAALVLIGAAHGASDGSGEWRAYGGSNANLKYAPLDQINAENVSQLRIAWRQSAMPLEVRRGRGAIGDPDQPSGHAAHDRRPPLRERRGRIGRGTTSGDRCRAMGVRA